SALYWSTMNLFAGARRTVRRDPVADAWRHEHVVGDSSDHLGLEPARAKHMCLPDHRLSLELLAHHHLQRESRNPAHLGQTTESCACVLAIHVHTETPLCSALSTNSVASRIIVGRAPRQLIRGRSAPSPTSASLSRSWMDGAIVNRSD